MKKKGGKELTVKERKMVKAIITGSTIKDALLEAGYSPKTAEAQPVHFMARFRGKMNELMDEMGLSDEKLLEVLQEGLKATKVISAQIIEREAGGTDKDFIEVPDHATRHKYLETALKLKDAFPDVKVSHSGELGIYRTQDRGLADLFLESHQRTREDGTLN